MSGVPSTGIVDPWRVIDDAAAHKPTAPRKRKIDLDEIDFGRDLRAPRCCTFDSQRGGSILIRGRDIDDQSDALRQLVGCLFQILERSDGPDLFERIGVGFVLGEREWLLPRRNCPASLIETASGNSPRAALYFLQQSCDEGLLRLIKLLSSISARSGKHGRDILQRWGVVPLLR
jgi:hypothetical protein